MPESELKDALDRLISEDADLINWDVNERSMTHKLAEYLQTNFPDWNVDCEYNRIGHDQLQKILDLPVSEIKTDDTEAKTVYPDIIVHHRGYPGEEDNLLAIEVKKSSNQDSAEYDKQKLHAFLEQLNYQYAAFVEIIVDGDPNYRIDWIK